MENKRFCEIVNVNETIDSIIEICKNSTTTIEDFFNSTGIVFGALYDMPIIATKRKENVSNTVTYYVEIDTDLMGTLTQKAVAIGFREMM